MAFEDEFAKFATPDEVARAALREEIERLLMYCTEAQRRHLPNVWHDWRKRMEPDLKAVLSLVQRTVSKNRAGRPNKDFKEELQVTTTQDGG